MVVCAHAAVLDHRMLMPWFHSGIYGVDLFFVISGFVMVYTTAGKAVTPGRFMLNRVVRIVPLYWVLTLAVFAIALIAPTLLQFTQANWLDLLRSLFFVPFQKNGGLVQPILFLGWTLNYEMFFYALFALSLAVRSLGLRTGLMIAVLILLVTVGQLVRPQGVVAVFYTDPIILEFAYGMALAYLNHRVDFRRWPTFWPVVLLLAASAGVAVAVAIRAEFELRAFYWGIPAALIVWAVVALEAQGWRYMGKRLLLVGAASYSLYLAHPFAFIPVEKLVKLAHLNTPALTPWLFVGSLALMLAAGIVVHLLLERPLTEYFRSRTRGPGVQGEARALWPWRLSSRRERASEADEGPRRN